jgi:xanthine dehydrogenase small subunit
MSIRFQVDGRAFAVDHLSPNTTLLEWLRLNGFSGTKEGCAEGDCGACTVAVLDRDAPHGPTWRAINACIYLLPLCHGREFTTVQGAGSPTALHPAQQALVDTFGSQCGYCTPGFVMTMFEATYRDDLHEPWQLDDQLSGNLCRCTGYRPIREATVRVAGTRPDDKFRRALSGPRHLPMPVAPGLRYAAGDERHLRPADRAELWQALADHPEARVVCGATDLGLAVTKHGQRFPTLISLDGLADLRRIDDSTDTLWIGATTRLSDLEAVTARTHPSVHRMLRYFGARQIKNGGSVGGNLCNASPIGDLAPVLLSLDARVVIASSAGEREIPLSSFFLGYRQTSLRPGEILVAVRLPPLPADARTAAYKVSKRRELDISAVAAGIFVRVDADDTITDARVAWGGLAATPVRTPSVEAALVGRAFTEQSFVDAAAQLGDAVAPMSDHRGSAWYRLEVARNLLRGFYLETAETPHPQLGAGHSGTVLGSAP